MPRCPLRAPPLAPRHIDVTSENLPPNVRFVPSPAARALATTTPDDPVWRGSPASCEPGAIVRLRPPADASDADVARVRAAHERAGAVRCRVEPRAPGAEVLARPRSAEKAERRTFREVVMGMAAEARPHDREALVAVLDEALTEEGL